MKRAVVNQNERWTASYYFVAVDVKCPVGAAWDKLLDYRTWNPSFQGAEVKRVSGNTNTAGERVLIGKTEDYMDGQLMPRFYADTVVVDRERRQVIWYVYPTEGRLFRNFVDFRLVPRGKGVRFEISYYEQNQLEGIALKGHRSAYEADLEGLATAFKAYCESKRRRGGGRNPSRSASRV